MFIPVHNATRDYAWGAPGAISALFGRPPVTEPEAELWFGTHPGSPTLVAGGGTLQDTLRAHPGWGGDVEGQLPILFKVLAAATPLSIQVHPNPEQARLGFERENAAGIPLDSPTRNYRDPFAKPELIVALRDGFEALAGFRPVAQTRDALAELGLTEYAATLDGEPAAVLSRELSAILGGDRADVVAALSAAAESATGPLADTVRRLSAGYPGDPGILVAAFLHRVSLNTGEALYLPAGSPHAYLAGIGLELMQASDNVLRGGITPKHVDIAELLAIVDFREQDAPLLRPETIAPGVHRYRPADGGFALLHVVGEAEIPADEPAFVLSISGESRLRQGAEADTLARGEAVFVPLSDLPVTVDSGSDVWFARADQTRTGANS